MEPPAESTKTQSETSRRSRAWIGWLLLCLLLLGTVAGMAALLFGWHEPRHADQTMSYWLAELNGTNYLRREVAAEALSKIGEPSLEPLRFAMRKERSFLFELRDRVWKVAPAPVQQHIPKPWNVDDLQFNACVAASALGPKAESLVPELILLLTNSSPAIQSRATFALGKIGTNAHPLLLGGVHSSDAAISAVCQAILARQGVQFPVPEGLKTRLRTFLGAQEVPVQEWADTMRFLSSAPPDLTRILAEEFKSVTGTRRYRAAALLSRLQTRDDEIASALLEGARQGPPGERMQYLAALMTQIAFLQPHREELENLIPQAAGQSGSWMLQQLENQFGFSEAKWRTVENAIASGDPVQQQSAADDLQGSIRRRRQVERSVSALSEMLSGTNETVVLHILRSSASYHHPLLPALQKLEPAMQQRPATDSLRLEFENTLNVITNPGASYPSGPGRQVPKSPSRVDSKTLP